MEAIDEQLKDAEKCYTWNREDCWDYIVQVKSVVYDLERRVQKSKDNIATMQQVMNAWAKQPLFFRKENKKEALINLEDKRERVNKKFKLIQEDGYKLRSLAEVLDIRYLVLSFFIKCFKIMVHFRNQRFYLTGRGTVVSVSRTTMLL